MKPEFGFTQKTFNTQFAPLCVIGDHLQRLHVMDSLLNMGQIKQKNRTHTPGQKLLDAFLLILAGYPSLNALNTHLRPDPILATAWHRTALAEQSTISRTFDQMDESALLELRTISWDFWHQHSRLKYHDWRQPLVVDLDLSPLPASAASEQSTKGYMGEKTKPVVN